MPPLRIEICLVGRRPAWGSSRLCSIREALLRSKRKEHSWGWWKAEIEASENRTVVGRNNGCGKRVTDEEEEG